jgi:predicted nucleic acid-binding protein
VAVIALLDANVLWSAALRDTLLLAAEQGLYRPVWTRAILDEMATSLKRYRPDLDPARLDRTVALMLQHFPEALVEGYERLVPVMTNAQGDRHVLAAAVRAGAAVVVTSNVADFPASACAPYGIEVQTPDDFLCDLWDAHPDEMAQVLRTQAAQLVRPAQTTQQVAETLRRTAPRLADTALCSGLL